jgi:cyclophilin family peptidyl-prolyl cis-trans isomerase/HEAT repeat protein
VDYDTGMGIEAVACAIAMARRRARDARLVCGLALTLIASACASAPTAPPGAIATLSPAVTLDKKIAWILRLEHERVLRDATLTRSGPTEAGPREGTFAPATTPDLEALALDTDAAVRRRAVLAIGRVGSRQGVAALVAALRDTEEGVRATAAFALGLVGDAEAMAPLQTALADPSPLVRGRAVEGLGLVGQPGPAVASAIVTAAAGCRAQLAGPEPDDEASAASPELDACRLALFALVRLRQYDALASIALGDNGQPVSHWWPIAYALQRIADPRAAPALLVLAAGPGVYTPAFALRGLASLHDVRAAPLAQAIAARAAADVRLRVTAVRALGQIGGAAAVGGLLTIVDDPAAPRNLALESVAALGAIGDRRAFDTLIDRLADPWPAMRSAALAAAAKVNPDGFLLVVSSLGPDRDWSVRAALASVLGTLPADRVAGAVEDLASDQDARVRGPAIEALARLAPPDLPKRLFDALDAPDFAVRAIAARLVGDAHPEGGISHLVAAYARGQSDAASSARAAAIAALAKYGGADATRVIRQALNDPDWPVRSRAAELLHTMGETDAQPVRPAPTRQPAEFFESARLLHPAFSPHAYIDLRAGTIEIELNVVDAPVTTATFIELARSGFFNGLKVHRLVPNFVIQAGDPRGDGAGGPGYSIRDELSPLPYGRGTVGIALDGRDTGGSQFFITLSPQPHLDGKYTVFGRVVKGDELLDQVSLWDVIERVRIWDGVTAG